MEEKIFDLESYNKFKQYDIEFFAPYRIPGLGWIVHIDMDECYRTYGHPLWIYFADVDKTKPDFDDWIPLTVEDNPTIPYELNQRKFKIPNDQFNKICKWVSENQKALKLLADMKFDSPNEAFNSIT